VEKCSQWVWNTKIQWQKALSGFGGGISIGKELSMGSEEEILLAICYLGRDVACYVSTVWHKRKPARICNPDRFILMIFWKNFKN